MKDILLLTDFSELSDYAKSLADKVAQFSGANLHVLKIVNVPAEIPINENGELLEGMSSDLSSIRKEKEDSDKKITTWTSDIKANVISNVIYGRVLTSSQDYIKQNKIELVIMGTHGVSGLEELLSGSVTEHLILKNKVPVLSLKCNRDDIDFSDFLITGCFDPVESKDLEVLKALQQVFNTTIHLLTVITQKDFITSADAVNKMREFAKINRLENTVFHIHNDKTIEDGIVNFSNNYDTTHALDIDIIAVEKKQKSQLGYILTGCQATSFVNHIFRPIVTYTNN